MAKRINFSSHDMPGLFDDFESSMPVHPDIERHARLAGLTGGQAEVKVDGDPLGPVVVKPVPNKIVFMSFGSGSSGNCAYIGDARSGFLIDAGVDCKRIERGLNEYGLDMNHVKGICITHDHSDHVRFAYSLLRRYRHMKLYATPKTMNGLLRRHSISRRIQDYHQPIFKEFPFRVGDLSVTAFETSHDGTDNCGYCIEGGGTSFVVATDTGIVTPRADHYIRTAEHLMIEADYDAAMLRNGPYPERLKARIASCEGHLDNAVTAAYLAGIVPAYRLRTVFLCHLSHINNTPQLAFHCVRTAGGASTPGIVASHCAGTGTRCQPRH